MRIAYFIETIIPSERANTVHVMKMCEALEKEGNQVTLFCDSGDESFELGDIYNKYGIKNKFNICQTRVNKIIRKYGHRYWGVWSAFKKTYRIRSKEFDVIYGRSFNSLNHLKDSFPFVYESHSEPTKRNQRFEKKLLESSNCKGLVVITNTLKDKYIELFPDFPAEKIYVLHDCANIEDLNSSDVALLNKKTCTDVSIGYLGSLYPGKCMEIMIPLAKSRPNYLFHVVGGTEEWVRKWKAAALKENVSNILFYGFVENSLVGNYYRAFDICIMPFSKDIYVDKNKRLNIGNWISPLKLFEAMSYGKAILVSNIPTIREVMEDGEDCLLANPEDISEWGYKLDILVNDSDLRRQIGDAAKRKLSENYTWEQRAKRILDIFKE